jgi:hypothetical protein
MEENDRPLPKKVFGPVRFVDSSAVLNSWEALYSGALDRFGTADAMKVIGMSSWKTRDESRIATGLATKVKAIILVSERTEKGFLEKIRRHWNFWPNVASLVDAKESLKINCGGTGRSAWNSRLVIVREQNLLGLFLRTQTRTVKRSHMSANRWERKSRRAESFSKETKIFFTSVRGKRKICRH